MATSVYTDKVAAKIIRAVKNKLNIANTMSRKFEMEFEDTSEPIGQILRIKKPARGRVVDGIPWVGGPTERIYVSTEAFQPFHVEYQSDALETMFEMERTQSARDANIYNPIVDDLVQEIDSRAARFIGTHTTMHVGALGTTPTSFDTWGSAVTRINEKDGMNGRIRSKMSMSPEAQRTMVSGTPNALALFHNGGRDANDVFTEGDIPRYSGFDVQTSMSLYSHTSGVIQTQATLVVATSSADGDLQIVVTCTSGDTFKAGDWISCLNRSDVNPRTRNSLFRDRQLEIAGAPGTLYTATATTITLPLVEPLYGPNSVYQNILTLPVALDAITFLPGTAVTNGAAKQGTFGMCYTNDAFGIIGAKFPKVRKGTFDMVSEYQDPDTGIQLSIIGWTVPETRQQRWRCDACIGFVNLMGDTSAALIGMLS